MIAAAVLAAGAGRRIGIPKAVLKIGEHSFLEIILRNLESSGIGELIIIAGFQFDRVNSLIPQDLSCKLLRNSRPEDGPLSSLQLALQSFENRITGCLMVLVDHPLVTESTYRELVKTSMKYPDSIIIPTFADKNGHPVCFGRRFFAELLSAPLDQGARYVVRKNKDSIVRLIVDDPGVTQDIDTPEDYHRYVRT